MLQNSSRTLITEPLNFVRERIRVTYDYQDANIQTRASALVTVSFSIGLLALVAIVILSITNLAEVLTINVVTSLLLFLTAFVVLVAVKQGLFRLTGILYISLLLVASLIQFFPWGLQLETALIFSIIPVLASIIVGPRATFVAQTFTILGLFAYLIPEGGQDFQSRLASFVLIAVAMTILSILNNSVSSQLQQMARRTTRVNRQLETAALLSQTAAVAVSMNELMNTAVDQIRDAYGFYHAQVFLNDEEGRMARLEASTGQAGEALIARGHALPVGSQSVIGRCTTSGNHVVVNDTTADATHRPNPLLPKTRAELALPLVVENRVIGALDVQSEIPNVFHDEDVRSLQVIASQLAVSIDKARLLGELQSRASENENLLRDAQANLREIEDLNRRLTREGWSDYLRARRTGGTLGYTMFDGSIKPDSDWTAPMRQAYQGESSIVIRQDQQVHIAAVPLNVRGEVIGVLEIERSGESPWTETELEMAEILVGRLALAIENARLYEQANLAVERERIVNQIGQEVQEAGSIDEVLQSALSEISSMLGVSKGIVQISPKDRT